MKNFKSSIHSPEQVWLRQALKKQREELGYSQRDLAKELNVIYSLIGKIETGDRSLNIFEFILYCKALKIDPKDLIEKIMHDFSKS